LENATGQAPGDAEEANRNASGLKPGEANPNDSQSKALLPPDNSRVPEAPPPQLQGAAERKRLVNAVIDNLKKYYVDPEVARKTADALLVHEKNGDDDKMTDGGAFAGLLTKQIREVSHDMHLEVVYSQEPLPDFLPEPTAEGRTEFSNSVDMTEPTSQVMIMY
jgi:hypothetical protein